MKSLELNILTCYLNNWISACNQQIENCTIESNKLIKDFTINKNSCEDLHHKIENSISMMHQSAHILQQIADLAKTKALIYEMLTLISEFQRDKETFLTHINPLLIKPYVYERLLDQFISILESHEMYEACSLIKEHLNSYYQYNKNAA